MAALQTSDWQDEAETSRRSRSCEWSDSDVLQFSDTLKPFLYAWLASVAALTALDVSSGRRLDATFGVVLLLSAGVILLVGVSGVLSVMVFSPEARDPPLWLAVLWGAVLAGGTSALLLLPAPAALMRWVIVGGVAGATYWATIKLPGAR